MHYFFITVQWLECHSWIDLFTISAVVGEKASDMYNVIFKLHVQYINESINLIEQISHKTPKL